MAENSITDIEKEKSITQMTAELDKKEISSQSITDFTFDPKFMLLLVSDVHIGDPHSQVQMFDAFLKKIIDQKKEVLENLQYIIILGDFYDRLISSLNLINKEANSNSSIQSIFDQLKKIQGILKIPIISLALGNHENPWKDAQFPKESRNFTKSLNKFPKINFSPDLICQCATLDFIADKWQLSLYQTLDALANRKTMKPPMVFNKISERPISEENGYRCLLLHGHQLMTRTPFFNHIWQACLVLPDDIKKEIFGMYKKQYDDLQLSMATPIKNFHKLMLNNIDTFNDLSENGQVALKGLKAKKNQSIGDLVNALSQSSDKQIPDNLSDWITQQAGIDDFVPNMLEEMNLKADPSLDKARKKALKLFITSDLMHDQIASTRDEALKINMENCSASLNKKYKDTLLKGVNYLVFGHTHDVSDQFTLTYSTYELPIESYNTGAWTSIAHGGSPELY